MARRLRLFIQYDDDSPPDARAFAHDPSTWDLGADYFLSAGIDLWFRIQVLGWTGSQAVANSPATRGIPATFGLSAIHRIADEPISGWISGSELKTYLKGAPKKLEDASRATALLFDLVFLLSERFGDDRVRLVFAFI